MYLLDTNVVSEIRKIASSRADRKVAAWARGVDAAQTYLSAITISELEHGVLLAQRRDPDAAALLRDWLDNDVSRYGAPVDQGNSEIRPEWVSDEMFPFESRFVDTPRGHLMHYVDEGAGQPIVFVHGNPAWSFEFRHLIDGLRSGFRCIAADHIGFGLSSRSDRKEDHRQSLPLDGQNPNRMTPV